MKLIKSKEERAFYALVLFFDKTFGIKKIIKEVTKPINEFDIIE
jgi:hypothetical protein